MTQLSFTGLQHPADGKGYRLHLVCPLQKAPFHRTRLLRKGDSEEVKFQTGPFYLVLHSYVGNKLSGRQVVEFEPATIVRPVFGQVAVQLQLLGLKAYDMQANFRSQVESVNERLAAYVQADLLRVQQMQPREMALQHTHSVYYEFPLQPTMFVPYVAIAGRMGKELSCSEDELHDWQSFFIREMPIAMRECAVSPAQFISTCRAGAATAQTLFYVYNSIAVAFSRMISSRVSYAKDIEATTMPDYVGFNLVGNLLVGDCEDGSQLAYDTMRIFRTIFPVTQKDLESGQTSLCYHMAHFLNKADLWMFQGAVGENRNTHVWCAIVPPTGPVHYVESTGLPEISFYKHLVRAWQLDHAGHFADYLFVDPERPQQYGMPSTLLTHVQADGAAVLQRWGQRNSTAIDTELRFVNLLDAPLMHAMNLLMRRF